MLKSLARIGMDLAERLAFEVLGVSPLEIDGRVMDRRVQVLGMTGSLATRLTNVPPRLLRAMCAWTFDALDDEARPDVTWLDKSIPGPAGAMRARLYEPADAPRLLPGLVFFHMGGYLFGDLATSHTLCTVIAAEGRCRVLSCEYRLAPEHRFPAAYEDARAAWEWAVAHSEEIGFEAARMGVGGDSAGGSLSAVVSQAMKRERGPMPRLQVLVYPATDLACRDGSMVTCATCHALTTEKIEDLKANYMTDVERESRDVRVSPMYEPDLAGLPAALVVTAGFDPLRDQGEAYANKLDDSGVEVSYRCEDGLCHGFTAMGGVVPAARAACHALAGDIGRMLRADPPRRTRGSPRGKVRDRRE